MATSRAPFSTSTMRADTPTVMVVGKSGMGKSTLCNYLLYGRSKPDDGFLAESGSEPITTACSSKFIASTPAPRSMQPAQPGGPLTMIDTPGIPDPKGRTLTFYNNIVMAARGSDGLNAVIIAVHYGVDRQQIRNDFEMYRILLKQFARLPCLKILLCRARIQPDLTDAQHQAEVSLVNEWVDTIRANGGMDEARTFVLYDNDSQAAQLFGLRQAVCEAPKVPILDWNIRTYPELMESAVALTTDSTRAEALKKKLTRLQQDKAQLEHVNSVLVTTYVVSAITLGDLGLDLSANFYHAGFDFLIKSNKQRRIKIDEEVAEIENELETGLVNAAALENDRRALEELDQVAASTTTT